MEENAMAANTGICNKCGAQWRGIDPCPTCRMKATCDTTEQAFKDLAAATKKLAEACDALRVVMEQLNLPECSEY
jgi:hypothetical protein